MAGAHPSECGCPHCSDDKPFAMPDELIEKIEKGEIVLFAGAGVSTENKRHCKSTFYEEVKAELHVSEQRSFPDLMTQYCAQPDGRIKLLEKIKKRFEYFEAFEDFSFYMTRFHRAISPLYMLKDIITTNWEHLL